MASRWSAAFYRRDQPCHLSFCPLVNTGTSLTKARKLYWRTATGIEVDFVIETPDRLLPIEIKASARITTADGKGLEAFLDEYPDLADGVLLIYGGNETFPLTRRVLATPWWRVI